MSATDEVDADAEVGLRARKKAMTRQALEDQALRLFAEQGFEHTTVDEIAAACDVSRRTFFRYFSSKEDVLSHEEADHGEATFELIAARPADEPPLQSLRVVILALAAQFAERKENLLARSRIMRATPSLRSADWDKQNEGVDRIVDALSRRSPDPLDAEQLYQLRLLGRATLAALMTALDRWVDGDGQEDIVALAAQALDLLASGFETPPDQ
jgi:AcrR family transcriptional regulator